MKIGVLALQGDFDAHRKRLEELGAEVVLVKKPEQLDEIDGLVIPGGESGTFLKLLGEEGFAKLKDFVRAKPTFGTCAGASCSPQKLRIPSRPVSARSTSRVRRNAYGRQIDSSIREGTLPQRPDRDGLHPRAQNRARRPRRRSDRHRRRRPGARPPGQDPGRDLPSRTQRRPAHPSLLPRPGQERQNGHRER